MLSIPIFAMLCVKSQWHWGGSSVIVNSSKLITTRAWNTVWDSIIQLLRVMFNLLNIRFPQGDTNTDEHRVCHFKMSKIGPQNKILPLTRTDTFPFAMGFQSKKSHCKLNYIYYKWSFWHPCFAREHMVEYWLFSYVTAWLTSQHH